jgi:hypothetical protein
MKEYGVINRISSIGLLVFGINLLAALSCAQVPGMTLDQANDNYGYYYSSIGSGWQSFAAGTNGYLGAVQLWIYSTGAEAGYSGGTNWSATLSIREGEGTAGAVLAEQAISGDGVLQRRTFILDMPVRQTAGNKYTVTFGSSTTDLTVRVSANVYTNGRCAQNSGYDYNFMTHVISSDWSEAAYRDTNFTAAATVISNAAQLAQFAHLVNSGTNFSGMTITLAANINLAGHFWTAAGTDSAAFSGTFDGAGNTIRGVTINRPDAQWQGLFGSASGPIRNLTVADADIAGGGYVGCVAGYAGGPVSNCTAIGSVSGTYYVGGVAGYSMSAAISCVSSSRVTGVVAVGGVVGVSPGQLVSCGNSGPVLGDNYVGGVVGLCPGQLVDCGNSGPVSSLGGERIGGVAGALDSTGTITRCNNSGSVEGPTFVGGIVGDAGVGTVDSCINTGTISSDGAVGGIAGVQQGAIQNSVNSGSVTGFVAGGVTGDATSGAVRNCANSVLVSGSDMVGGVIGWNEGVVIENCINSGGVSGSGSLGGLAGRNEGTVTNSYWKNTGTEPFNREAAGDNVGTVTECYSFGAGPGTLTSPVTVGGVTTTNLAAALNAWMLAARDMGIPGIRRWTPGSTNTYPALIFTCWSDDGNYDTNWYTDAAAQFIIGTASEMAGLAVMVNRGNDFSNKTITLSADIILSDRAWWPIGKGSVFLPFRGTFDGNGKMIAGVFVDLTTGVHAEGLFGFADVGATIKNLSVVDSDIAGTYYAGGIVGGLGGTLQNSKFEGRVSAYAAAGGLAGYVYMGKIENCYSCARVSSWQVAGGVAGANDTVVSNCYWLYTGEAPYNLAAVGTNALPGPVACSSFSNAPGLLTPSATVGGITTNRLTAALNAWVDVNWSPDRNLYNWTAGAASAYPTLTPGIRVGETRIPQMLSDGFAAGVTLAQVEATVAAYTNAHPSTTSTSFGDLLCDADAMGLTLAELAVGDAILDFNPYLTITRFDQNTWILTFAVANGIDASATAAMNRLAGSTSGCMKLLRAEALGDPVMTSEPTVQFQGDGTATASFLLPDPPSSLFFRLMLEHQPQ